MSTTDQPAPANPNKALWEKGDFTRIAGAMRESGEALVGTLGITEGLDVLDLGCGDGPTAVPEAKLGGNVLGVDISRPLVAAGNARAQRLGLGNLRFQEGDASDLRDLDDDSFDLVVSIFGAMFAPRPDAVAKEMVRVTRPGGRIVMGNWIPNDPTLVAQILRSAPPTRHRLRRGSSARCCGVSRRPWSSDSRRRGSRSRANETATSSTTTVRRPSIWRCSGTTTGRP